MHQVKDKLSCCQNQRKEAAHAFDRLNAQVFNIEVLFLVKVITVFDLAAQALVGVDL